jgi:CTP synthase
MLYLVEDAAPEPAQYGALAALLAATVDCELIDAGARFDERRFADAHQHVTADGRLVASGLVWRTRTGRSDALEAPDIDELLTAAKTRGVVVALHPRDPASSAFISGLRATAARLGVELRRLQVVRAADCASVVDVDVSGQPIVLQARQDRYGRWSAASVDERTANESALSIALVGRESEQREQYPATLAALGDAADASGLHVDVRFVAAQDLDDASAPALLGGVDGILLPGGADMTRVSGQIAAARVGWLTALPVVGLCLGMQSMATAIARLALNADDIGLMEAQPDARIASFVPIGVDNGGVLLHRLGAQPVFPVPGSRIARMLGERPAILCNHRYRLNPELETALSTMGVAVSARDESGRIADAIEAADHPFFAGMQGHPELSSQEGEPHPLLMAFLRAAARLER